MEIRSGTGSGNPGVGPRIYQIAQKTSDFTQRSSSTIQDTFFDINNHFPDPSIDLFAGVKSFNDATLNNGFPVSMLYFYYNGTTYTGLRVYKDTIDMFIGPTIGATGNLASFGTGANYLYKTTYGITPADATKNTIIPTTAWVYQNLPFNNPNNSRFLGSTGIIASNVDATNCGSSATMTTGIIYYYAIYLTEGTILNRAGACVISGSTNNFRLALFSGTGNLLAYTGSISGTGTTFGPLNSSITSLPPYTTSSTGFYYLAIQVTGTSPSFSATNATASTAQAINYPNISDKTDGYLSYYRAATTTTAGSTGGPSIPSPASAFTLRALGPQIWVAVA
jgi:hypothetical protein